MKKLVTSVLVGLVTLNVLAQTTPGRPRLVVGIVVDQMRTDYIEYLRGHFGDKGFRKLMKDGVYLRDVDFNAEGLDAVSATAMLYTGAPPSCTGVPASMVYDPVKHSDSPALADTKTVGNFTNDSFSPENLLLSTVSDEVAIDGGGMGTVYAIAGDPQQAIVMAGHAGTGAAWINSSNGNWATTPWYRQLPPNLSARNYNRSISSRIDTMQWKPSVAVDKMPGLPRQKTLYPFKHTFPRGAKDVYLQFAASPLGNSEITDAAIECLKEMRIGATGNTLDMLSVGYSLAPYKYVADGDYRAELTDSYLRLDKDLGRLFDAIDQYVGAGNAVIWISSTGYYDDAVVDDKKYRIPGGEFSMKRAKSLLNSYLSARYGNSSYIDGFKNGHLWFDHQAIEEKNLNLNDLLDDARTFLAKMSGVADVYTLADIMAPTTPEENRLRRSTDPKKSGDLFVKYYPGWTIVDDISYPAQSRPSRDNAVLTPAFIMGAGVAPVTIDTEVDATALAPTVTDILRIRSPNGSRTKPMTLPLP